jgi:hypothetical protein
VDVVLQLVEEHGGQFNFINVATSLNMLAKLARNEAKRAGSPAQVRDTLTKDQRFATLIELVGVHCGKLGAQGVANVLNRFFGEVTSQLWRAGGRREARGTAGKHVAASS